MKKLLFKPKFAHLRVLTLSLICLLIIVGVNSCKKQTKLSDSSEASSNKPLEKKITVPNVQGISFAAFLDSTKKFRTNAVTNLFTNSQQSSGQLKITDVNSSTSINLFIDSIKLIKKSGHQTYTIPVKQVKANDITFRNLIIDTYNGNVSAFLATYTPDSTYLRSFIKGLKVPFTGKGHLAAFDLGIASGLQIQSSGLKNNVLACYTIDVLVNIIHVSCTGQGHFYGDPSCKCGDPDPCTPAFDIEVWGTEDECFDINIMNYGGGGGGGSSGGTSPNTPPDYDPCDPGQSPTSSGGLKVQKAYSPCDIPPDVPPDDNPTNADFITKKITITTSTRQCVADIVNSIKLVANLQVSLDDAFSNSPSYSTVSGMIDRIANSANFNAEISESSTLGYVTDVNGNSIPKNAQTVNPAYPGGPERIILGVGYLNTATDLSVARTLIHEMVHTYFQYATTLITDPSFAQFLAANALLFDKSGNPLPDPYGDLQHEQMAKNYVRYIADVLVGYAQLNGITSPNANQDLQSYCLDLAWGGLQGTKAYQYAPNQTRIYQNVDKEVNNASNSTHKKGC